MHFVDFEKAFDMIQHEVLVERRRGLGLRVRDMRLITDFCWVQRVVVKVGDDKGEWVKIERERQGFVLLLDLFPFSGVASRYSMNTLQFPEKIDNLHYAPIALLFLKCVFKLQI